MFSIERVLKKFDNIMSDGVLCGEALRPCQNLPRTESSLLDREGKRKTQVNDVWSFAGVCIGRHICRSSVRGKKCINRVGEIVYQTTQDFINRSPVFLKNGPNKTVASPVFSASETLYFCCRIENVLSPFKMTSQTRLEQGYWILDAVGDTLH